MAITQNQPTISSSTVSPIKVSTQPIQVVDQTIKAVIPQGGTSIIAPNPVETIQKATPVPTVVVPTPVITPVVSGVLVDAYTSRPIVVATPNIVSNAVKAVAGSFGGGGGGGGRGGASSEEAEDTGAIEEPKKPNYLLLALLALGGYLAFKKLK